MEDLAESNLARLKLNPYPGRGLVLGTDALAENLIEAYWIMGRSPNSRNRIFVSEDGMELKTMAADQQKVEDPSLIIYTAMNDDSANFVVSNGHQTNQILNYPGIGLGMGYFIENQNCEYKYEPDAPNYTPRISGLIVMGEQPFAEILILKKSPFSLSCDKQLYRYDNFLPGYGYCVTTYNGDGDPLPSFTGEPYLLPLDGDIKELVKKLWDCLNEENRVSLAVKFINKETGDVTIEIINKYATVEP